MNTASNIIQFVPGNTGTSSKTVASNKKRGFALIYKSLKDTPFYKNPERKSLWLHLLLEAAYEECTDSFNGHQVTLQRGQLIGSVNLWAEACGISYDSARRSIEYFEAEGMISVQTKKGKSGFTLVKLVNFESYQDSKKHENSADYDANHKTDYNADYKSLSDNGFHGTSADYHADLNADYHAEALNNINNKPPIVPHDLQSADAELPDADTQKTKRAPAIDYQAFADVYNDVLGDRLPRCEVMNDKRKRALKKFLPQLKQPTTDCFGAYLTAFAHTARPFYFGDNDRGWRASFDFMLRQDTLTATKEGSISDSRNLEEDDE